MDMNFPHERVASQDRDTGSYKAVNLDVMLAQLSLQQMAVAMSHTHDIPSETMSPISARARYFAGGIHKRANGRRVPTGNFSPAHAARLKKLGEQPPILVKDGEFAINRDNSAIVKNVKLYPVLRQGTQALSAHRGQI